MPNHGSSLTRSNAVPVTTYTDVVLVARLHSLIGTERAKGCGSEILIATGSIIMSTKAFDRRTRETPGCRARHPDLRDSEMTPPQENTRRVCGQTGYGKPSPPRPLVRKQV